MTKPVVFLGVVLFSVVTLSACQQAATTTPESKDSMDAPAMEGQAPAPENAGMTQEATQVQEQSMGDESKQMVALTANNFSFSTKTITAKKGSTLTVEVMNTEGVHDFVIDELAVNSGKIPVGEKVMLTIPTDKPGTYEYYCSIGSHRAMGMIGTLTITE